MHMLRDPDGIHIRLHQVMKQKEESENSKEAHKIHRTINEYKNIPAYFYEEDHT